MIQVCFRNSDEEAQRNDSHDSYSFWSTQWKTHLDGKWKYQTLVATCTNCINILPGCKNCCKDALFITLRTLKVDNESSLWVQWCHGGIDQPKYHADSRTLAEPVWSVSQLWTTLLRWVVGKSPVVRSWTYKSQHVHWIVCPYQKDAYFHILLAFLSRQPQARRFT